MESRIVSTALGTIAVDAIMIRFGQPGRIRELVASKQSRRRPGVGVAPVKPPGHQSSFAVDYEVLARFRYELRKFQAFSKAAAKKTGLTPQQHQALLTIRGFSGQTSVSVGDLAEFLLIRHHTAVELMNRMVKLGLVDRIVDEADARRALLKVTKEGKRRLQRLSKIHLEELQAIGPTLTRLLKPFRRS
jgi:DNA-binding MarR family transcriptional regulator